jgi:electron transfer flavoprotein alpha/beta subunit
MKALVCVKRVVDDNVKVRTTVRAWGRASVRWHNLAQVALMLPAHQAGAATAPA